MSIQGIIYKIIHLDSEIQYIGSTCDSLRGRWRAHKNSYKYWLSNKEKYDSVAIYPYFERYGIERFKMILIKNYEVYDKKHLYAMEQLFINRTKCVNTNAALQLIGRKCMNKHYSILRSVKEKPYRIDNKDKIYEKQKQYREANRGKIAEQSKQYREANKQAIAQKASVKITCECGASVRKSDITRHHKTQKHITLLATQ